MIVPVGSRTSQDLMEIIKDSHSYRKNNLGGCRFVDLIGIHGWQE
jgi:protein-L-isoaspartate(D-aspartate) O-methyltransferase